MTSHHTISSIIKYTRYHHKAYILSLNFDWRRKIQVPYWSKYHDTCIINQKIQCKQCYYSVSWEVAWYTLWDRTCSILYSKDHDTFHATFCIMILVSLHTKSSSICFMQSLFTNCSCQNGESLRHYHTNWPNNITTFFSFPTMCVNSAITLYHEKLHDTHFGIEHVLFCTARITIHFISDQSEILVWGQEVWNVCHNHNQTIM
jgi:hypothetical protein